MKHDEPWKSLTIGGSLPGLGDFEHYIAVPKGIPTNEVLSAYQDKKFRKACIRFETAKAATDAVEDHNAKLRGRKQ